jgi:hypothetical protein
MASLNLVSACITLMAGAACIASLAMVSVLILDGGVKREKDTN